MTAKNNFGSDFAVETGYLAFNCVSAKPKGHWENILVVERFNSCFIM